MNNLACVAKWITTSIPPAVIPNKLPDNPWQDHQAGQNTRKEALKRGEALPVFVREFTIDASLGEAILQASALGIFDLYCNGHRVGSLEDAHKACDEMKPGHTLYTKRALSYTYDLKPFIREGRNRLLAVCAGGWYQSRISFGTYPKEAPSFIAALSITYANGESNTIYTDETWQFAYAGSILYADIWDGELQDLRMPSYAALSMPSTDYTFQPVFVVQKPAVVTPHVGPTVRSRPSISPRPTKAILWDGVEADESDYGHIVVLDEPAPDAPISLTGTQTVYYDLGQNIVGREHLVVRGKAGTKVQVVFAEMLNDSGEIARGNDGPRGSLYTINYRSAKSRSEYILSGSADGDICTPLFTFYGFRYAQISADNDIEIVNASFYVVGSDITEVGHISTSNDEVNQLLSNIRWGQRGNYLSIPTDCPQRDERLGWTGDTQVFCRTAAYQSDVLGFFKKWMQDVRDSQMPNGAIPDVIPLVSIFRRRDASAAWGDAAIIVPYTMYLMYGDTSIIEENLDMMCRYMDYLAQNPNYSGPSARYLDWLAFEPTEGDYISMIYYAYDALLMSRMTKAIGMDELSLHFATLRNKIIHNFAVKHLDNDFMPRQKTQTAYLLALAMDAIPEECKARAVAELKSKIVENGYRLSTGFVGTAWLCQILSACGEDGLAYSLLLQTECPSWLYSVRQGATTVWERWNSYTLADGFGDKSMNSFNHYAYGVVAEWMYRYMIGIEADHECPGFKHIILQPRPDTRSDEEMPEGQERITHASASYASPVGEIKVNWSMNDGIFTYDVTLPEDSNATLYLPGLNKSSYKQNGNVVDVSTQENGIISISLSGGTHHFEV